MWTLNNKYSMVTASWSKIVAGYACVVSYITQIPLWSPHQHKLPLLIPYYKQTVASKMLFSYCRRYLVPRKFKTNLWFERNVWTLAWWYSKWLKLNELHCTISDTLHCLSCIWYTPCLSIVLLLPHDYNWNCTADPASYSFPLLPACSQ
jgi:hypothetical protein